MREIDALVEAAAGQLAEIESAYQQSLDQHSLSPSLQVKIKNCLENQRSALDYLGRAVVEQHGQGTFRYYPLGQDKTDFARSMDENLPGVAQSRPDIRDAFGRWQPYNHPWLRTLNQLARENKHNTFTPQTKREQVRREVRKEGVSVSWDPRGVTLSSGVFIAGERVDPRTQRTASTVEVIYVGWDFDTPNGPVLATLREIQAGLRDLLKDIGHAAGL